MNESKSACCNPTDGVTSGGFRVESIVSVDERGQMLLPKDFRAKHGIEPGEKLALVSFENDGTLCCMCLIRTEALGGMIRNHLGPMLNEINPGAQRQEN